MTQRVALLGGRVEHSISPAMQEAGFRALGLDWRYEAIAVGEADLAPVVSGLRRDGWAGANVTLPHKKRVLELLDSAHDAAVQIGAANTIVTRRGRLHGFNTDAAGLVSDLRRLGVAIRGRPTVILGAGGAARAAAWGLAEAGAELSVLARTLSRARSWGKRWEAAFGRNLRLAPWETEAFSEVEAGSLIINATPVGMWPDVSQCPWPREVSLPSEASLYDLVYRPRPTRLVQIARAAGLEAWTGLGMLIEQGALSLELWTGMEAPRGVMRQAAVGALEVESDQFPHGG